MRFHFYHPDPGLTIPNETFHPVNGLDHWIVLTYLHLRTEAAVTIGSDLPEDAVILFHKRFFPQNLKPKENQFFICLQVDAGRHPFAHWHVVHNPYQASILHFPKLMADSVFDFCKTSYVHPWLQNNVIPRDETREKVLRHITYHGATTNLPKELQSQYFEDLLIERGLKLSVRSNPSEWNNFFDSDLTFSFRSFDTFSHYSKPFLKIVNSLNAGVPTIAGNESSSAYFRKHFLYIPHAGNIKDLLRLIDQIVLGEYNPFQQLSEFQLCKHEFQVDSIKNMWLRLITEAEYSFIKWKRCSAFKRNLFFHYRRKSLA